MASQRALWALMLVAVLAATWTVSVLADEAGPLDGIGETIRVQYADIMEGKSYGFFDSPNVVQVDASSIDALLESTPQVVMWFFAAWCHNCQDMQPAVDTAADAAAASNPDVVVAAICCSVDENREVCRKHRVSFYPYLAYFENGRLAYPLLGDRFRSEAGLKDFVLNPQRPPAPPPSPVGKPVLQLTSDTWEDALIEYDTLMVYFHSDVCAYCNHVKPQYIETARLVNGKETMLAAVDVAAEEYLKLINKVDFTPSWKLFKEGEFLLDYPGDPEPAKMAAWIGEPVAPPPPPPAYIDGETRGEGIVKNIVGPVTVPMLKRLKAHYDYTLLMFTTPWCGYCNHLKLQVVEAADELAKLFPDNFRFAVMDCVSEERYCRSLFVPTFPSFRWFDGSEVAEKWGPKQVSAESIVDHVIERLGEHGVEPKGAKKKRAKNTGRRGGKSKAKAPPTAGQAGHDEL